VLLKVKCLASEKSLREMVCRRLWTGLSNVWYCHLENLETRLYAAGDVFGDSVIKVESCVRSVHVRAVRQAVS
jgi:hypothetical protein